MPTTNLSETIDFNDQEFFIGLDVHKKSWSVTVRSLNHQVAHFTQPPSAKALHKTLQTKFAGGKFYSAYEAGFCGTGYHEQLCKMGITNIIVHAADIPQTDKQKKIRLTCMTAAPLPNIWKKATFMAFIFYAVNNKSYAAFFACGKVL